MSRTFTITGNAVAMFAGAALAVAGAVAFLSYRVATNSVVETDRRYLALTEKLSVDLTALGKSCALGRTSVGERKIAALRALPSAAAAVQKHDADVEAAQIKKDADIRKGDAAAAEAVRHADVKRREQYELAEQAEREANRAADDVWGQAQRAARQKYDAEIERISRLSLSEQPGARREAEAVYKIELQRANDDHNAAPLRNRQTQQRDRQRADAEYDRNTRSAQEQAPATAKAAEVELLAEKNAVRARFLTTVTFLPDASTTIAGADEELRKLDASCMQRERDLRAEFRRAADALRTGN